MPPNIRSASLALTLPRNFVLSDPLRSPFVANTAALGRRKLQPETLIACPGEETHTSARQNCKANARDANGGKTQQIPRQQVTGEEKVVLAEVRFAVAIAALDVKSTTPLELRNF